MNRVTVSLFGGLLLAIIVMDAHAQWAGETAVIEVRGQLQTGAFATFGNRSVISEPGSNNLLTQSARLMLTADPAVQWSTELHVVADLASTELTNRTIPGTERSAVLQWYGNNNRTSVSLDRLNLQYQSERLIIKAGRLPVNLSRSSYFAPFDWFAPFSAETFYRVYKPGVDALRLDLDMSSLSHLSLIQVQGYQIDPTSNSGWSQRADTQRQSRLMQLSLTQGNFQWDALAARVRGRKLLGMAVQGELWQWLGLRAEGYRAAAKGQGTVLNELTLELEHSWANSFTLHLAAFWHGAGADSVVGYPAVIALAQTRSPYLANRYELLAADFDMSPLLSLGGLLLRNRVDRSRLLALYARYSTGDESELTLGANLPAGHPSPTSEFGHYLSALNLQFRYYF